MQTRVREIIGNASAPIIRTVRGLFYGRSTVDYSKPSYEFWDKLRRGRATGLELSGLLARPVTEILTNWVMGDGISATLEEPDEYTDNLLRRFFRRNTGLFRQLTIDLYGLGDQYVIVNTDGSLSIPSPDTVEVIYHPVDYRRIIEAVVFTRLEHIEVIDRYHDDRREVMVRNRGRVPIPIDDDGTMLDGGQESTIVYDNLIGRIPVVHFANDRGGNEVNGRPMIAALYQWYSWYDDVLVKALNGVKRLANPILAVFDLDDAEATEQANSIDAGFELTESGEFSKSREVDIDAETPVLFLEKGSDLKFIGPGTGFTSDAQNMLKMLYLLYSEHLGLPDVVMGFEMSTARASAAEQLRTFYAKIAGLRISLEGVGADELLGLSGNSGFLAVVDLWLRTQSLVNPRVKTGSAIIEWPELSEGQMEMIKKWADSMYSNALITGETYVSLSQLIDDAAAEIERARAEVEAGRGDAPAVERDERDAQNDDRPLIREG